MRLNIILHLFFEKKHAQKLAVKLIAFVWSKYDCISPMKKEK